MNHEIERNTRAYFLGKLTPDELERFEKTYFTDDSVLDAVEMIEQELIEEYVFGRLTADDRARFETRYLTGPGRLKKVRFIQTLKERLPAHRRAVRPVVSPWAWMTNRFGVPFSAFDMAVAATVTVLAFTALWLGFDRYWLARENQTLTAEQRQNEDLRARYEREHAELEQLRKQTGSNPGPVTERSLGTGSAPDGEPASAIELKTHDLLISDSNPTRIVLAGSVRSLTFRLKPAKDSGPFRAILRRSDTTVVWQQENVRFQDGTGGKAVLVVVPANVVPSGTYILTLEAKTDREYFVTDRADFVVSKSD